MLKVLKEESGQGMVEYGLILVLVSLAAVGALSGLGLGPIKRMYEEDTKDLLEVLGLK